LGCLAIIVVVAPSPARCNRHSWQPLQGHQENDMKKILDFVRSTEFGIFDAVVLEYYTEHFEEGTKVHNAQKLSRNRELPRVLRGLQDDVKQWARWEASGYKDEIIRSAECILVEEFNRLLNNPLACGFNNETNDPNEKPSSSQSLPVFSSSAEALTNGNGHFKVEDEVRIPVTSTPSLSR
jgi:hypothetical protein